MTKKYFYFTLFGIMSCIIIIALIWNLQQWIWPRPEPPEFIQQRMPRRTIERARVNAQFVRTTFQAIPIVLAYMGSTLLEIVGISNQREKEAIMIRNQSLDAEMKFLKSQINPHFLFNAINNIYSQSVLKEDEAPENLLRLSKMLRYVLYECNADSIELDKEIDYIKNYVDLFKLKDSRGLNIILSLPEQKTAIRVAPLLFIPFIENAFKHSQVENLEEGWIDISLSIHGNDVSLVVKNSLPATTTQKDEVGGIGLQNVRRRLELLYPEKHNLEVMKESDRYIVKLKITAHDDN